MLASALMAGMFAAIASDQRSLGFDRDQSQAYSAAHAGLEKLTTQLAQLFVTDFSPSAGLRSRRRPPSPPSIPGFNFVAPGGGTGYAVTFNADTCSCPNAGNPLPSASNDITTGPFAGFKGLITPYTLTVTARSTGGGSEVRLRREVQTVAVPVFQFGVFGETKPVLPRRCQLRLRRSRAHQRAPVPRARQRRDTHVPRQADGARTGRPLAARERQCDHRQRPHRNRGRSHGDRLDLSQPGGERRQRHRRPRQQRGLRLEEPVGGDLQHEPPQHA